MKKEFSLQTALDLACAAQRINGEYVKFPVPMYASDGVLLGYKQANRTNILCTLGESNWKPEDGPELKPELLKVKAEDREMANEIIKFYKRLIFNAVAGDNEFKSELFTILSNSMVPENKMGFVACLPSTYIRDSANLRMEKASKTCDQEYLGLVGANLLDLDCEILSTSRSKNYDAFNVDAIIDNKMASWMSKSNPKIGPGVLIKANIKDHTKHWKYDVCVTRLNYVKVFQ